MSDLHGLVAIVTGGASGIGARTDIDDESLEGYTRVKVTTS